MSIAVQHEPAAARHFEQRVLRPLHHLAQRIRLYALLDGVAASLALALGLLIVQFVLDRALFLETGPRGVLLAIVVIIISHSTWKRIIRPLQRRLTADAMAAVIENRDRNLRDELISAVQFATAARLDPRFDSPSLVAALIDRVARRSGPSWHGLTHDGRFVRSLALGALCLILPLAAACFAPATVAVFVSRNLLLANTPWPSSIRLEPVGFVGGLLRWPRGDPLTIVVNAMGDAPQRGVRVEYESADGQRSRQTMAAIGDRQFRIELGPLDQSLRLRFLVGRWGVDERSDDYRVEALDRPSVRAIQIAVTPPAYAHQAAYQWPAGQMSGDVLNGSSVELTAETNKPVASAALVGAIPQPIPAVRRNERTWSAAVTPQRSGSFFFDLADADGLKDLRPISCVIRLVRDRPPRVRLTLPGAGDMIVPRAVLQIVAEIEDNLGIASADLIYRAQRAADLSSVDSATTAPASAPTTAPAATQPDEGVEPLPGLEPYQTSFSARRQFPLERLQLIVGDHISIFCRAHDFNPISDSSPSPADTPAGNEGRSTTYTLRVVSSDELLAELARRESEWRQEFEQVLKTQQRIREDVVDLHRRRTATAPADDPQRAYRDFARRQRQQGNRLKATRKSFEDLLAELEVNQLATSQIRRRLNGGVIEPLARLIDTSQTDAVALLDRQEAHFDTAAAADLDRLQDDMIQTMRSILANMLKWEGFNEAVGLLQDLLKLQSEVKGETQKEMERRLEELFGSPSSRPDKPEKPK